MRELKAKCPLLTVKGMRPVAKLDELEFRDHICVVERDREGLALLQHGRSARNHRPIGAQAAIIVEQVAGRINFGVEVRQRTGSAATGR